MPSHKSQRALDFMRCILPEQRRCARVHLPIQATVVFQELGNEAQTAFLRDMNMLGAFCYCSQRPNVGYHAKLTFRIPGDGAQMKASCEGVVVRVEELAPGAAIGVAIEFTRYQVTRPQDMEPEYHSDNEPFIAWTVDMVERMFSKAQRSARPSVECSQAA